MFESFSIIFLISALMSYVNYRWLKLPNTIGLLLMGLAVSFLIIATQSLLPDFYYFFCNTVRDADFQHLLLDGMLSLLLFAGAMHVNIEELKKERLSILLFASLGVLISTAIVGIAIYGLAPLVGVEVPLIPAFLFGALISPTDPIAVIAILKKAGVSKSMELKIEGESLFNDGVGVVVFSGILLLLSHMEGEGSIGGEVGLLFLEEAVGGILYGAFLGFVGYALINSIKENAQLVVLISLAVALGGYTIAAQLHVSGPLAMVVTGLIIGNKFNVNANQGESRKLMNSFWEVLDEALNGILFLLIGLSIHLLEFEWNLMALGLISIAVVLMARFISVLLPISLLKHQGDKIKTTMVLSWGGLRGGISLALAMSLPEGAANNTLLFISCVVVIFSVVIQGLSVGKLVKSLKLNEE